MSGDSIGPMMTTSEIQIEANILTTIFEKKVHEHQLQMLILEILNIYRKGYLKAQKDQGLH